MTNNIKYVFLTAILFVAAPLLVHAQTPATYECTEVYLINEHGAQVPAPLSGRYGAAVEVSAQIDGKIICALAVFEAQTNELKDISYETKEVKAGVNSLNTQYLSCNENNYMRLFLWEENHVPICTDFVFSKNEFYGSITSATLTVNDKTYNGFVIPDKKTIIFDVGSLSSEQLSDVKLSIETNDCISLDFKNHNFDIRGKIPFTLTGANGEDVTYTLEAINSEIRRMYDCKGAKIISSESAASMWGGNYRIGAPGWISTESAGGGAWFIEADGSQSAEISVNNIGSDESLLISRTSEDGEFILWSGDNKVFPALDKIHAQVRFKADKFEYGDFASFDVGASDKIYLTATDDSSYLVGFTNSDGNTDIFEYSPILKANRWYNLDFVFVRHSYESTNDAGLYNGYGVYAYLDGKYIGKTNGVSEYPAEYTGYITMNDFSDSTYSVFRLGLLPGGLTELNIDDICVTISKGTGSVDSSECAYNQRLFLASYYAGKNNKSND